MARFCRAPHPLSPAKHHHEAVLEATLDRGATAWAGDKTGRDDMALTGVAAARFGHRLKPEAPLRPSSRI